MAAVFMLSTFQTIFQGVEIEPRQCTGKVAENCGNDLCQGRGCRNDCPLSCPTSSLLETGLDSTFNVELWTVLLGFFADQNYGVSLFRVGRFNQVLSLTHKLYSLHTHRVEYTVEVTWTMF